MVSWWASLASWSAFNSGSCTCTGKLEIGITLHPYLTAGGIFLRPINRHIPETRQLLESTRNGKDPFLLESVGLRGGALMRCPFRVQFQIIGMQLSSCPSASMSQQLHAPTSTVSFKAASTSAGSCSPDCCCLCKARRAALARPMGWPACMAPASHSTLSTCLECTARELHKESI